MSPISPELLSVLRCPVTGSPLSEEGEYLVSATKDSNGNHVHYSIDEGIPVLLRPELLSAATTAGSDVHDGPAAN